VKEIEIAEAYGISPRIIENADAHKSAMT